MSYIITPAPSEGLFESRFLPTLLEYLILRYSHVAQVIRRLRRICAAVGSKPLIYFNTIAS